MKSIEKQSRNGDKQVFEIIENRREFKNYLSVTLYDAINRGIYFDAGTNLYWYEMDDSFHSIGIGDQITKIPNVLKIKKFLEINPFTSIIFGNIDIVMNEAGNWEADFQILK